MAHHPPCAAEFGPVSPPDRAEEQDRRRFESRVGPHAFGNVLRSVTRFPDLRGHNHVQITSPPVRELRAALRLLQFKPEDRMFKPVSWVLLGGRKERPIF